MGTLANSEDPDEMQQFTFPEGLHYLVNKASKISRTKVQYTSQAHYIKSSMK